MSDLNSILLEGTIEQLNSNYFLLKTKSRKFESMEIISVSPLLMENIKKITDNSKNTKIRVVGYIRSGTVIAENIEVRQ